MKILFDHGTPAPLRRDLHGHAVDTAKERGWDRLGNGDLLDFAESESYELLITTDQNMRYQQNFADRRLSVIVLLSTTWPYSPEGTEAIRNALEGIQPGEVREVHIPMKGEGWHDHRHH